MDAEDRGFDIVSKWCRFSLARGASPSLARLALGLYLASRAGEFSPVDPTLERLLARKPATLRQLLKTLHIETAPR